MPPDPRSFKARLAELYLRVENIQAAGSGSPELDSAIEEALRATAILDGKPLPGSLRWSTDLDAVLALLPPGHDFSLGRRDGVCWAWIQPNDSWHPAEHEARHDHPSGSGLVVANTPVLALSCAAILLRIRMSAAVVPGRADLSSRDSLMCGFCQ